MQKWQPWSDTWKNMWLTELLTKPKSHSGFKNKNTYAWFVLGIVTLSNAFCFHNKEHFCSFPCPPSNHLSLLFKVLRHSTRKENNISTKNPTPIPKQTNKEKNTCTQRRTQVSKAQISKETMVSCISPNSFSRATQHQALSLGGMEEFHIHMH